MSKLNSSHYELLDVAVLRNMVTIVWKSALTNPQSLGNFVTKYGVGDGSHLWDKKKCITWLKQFDVQVREEDKKKSQKF